jgi:DNA-binding NarL/FixJ family response regulator
MKSKYNRVILADTHHPMLEGIRGLLETMFEAVVMVADDTSLFDAAARLEADLIVVDLSLPVSRDVNIVRRLKERFPECKLIVLSVHEEPIAVEKVMAAGAQGFVLKRSAATDLIPAVRAVLRGRKYVSPHLKKEGKHKAFDKKD